MNIKRVTCVSAVTIGIGLAALTSGAAVAAAEPGPPCGFGNCQGPGGPDRGRDRGPDRPDRGPGGPHWDGPGDRGPGEPGGPPWGAPPPDLGWRGIDQGRFDHQPFNYNGSWVTPIFNPDFNNWGFWFLGIWIPL